MQTIEIQRVGLNSVETEFSQMPDLLCMYGSHEDERGWSDQDRMVGVDNEVYLSLPVSGCGRCEDNMKSENHTMDFAASQSNNMGCTGPLFFYTCYALLQLICQNPLQCRDFNYSEMAGLKISY